MILITGASRGIGKYLLEKYLDLGEVVFGTYNTTKPDSSYFKQYKSVQIENLDTVQNWINSIQGKEKLVLINCAGINYNCLSHKVDMAKWKRVIDINLVGTFNVINTILPLMRKEEYGRIINLSSVVAQVGIPGTSAYAASKAALWGMTRSIAKENANKGITINNLNLGYFNLGIIDEVPAKHQAKIKESIPNNKFGEPIEIFNTIQNLIITPYITGTSIDINGGLY
ncbi:MAG: SDR family NAD(P)-dependent oxidoreductase [Candidatus Marinimicrobia bacterium]|nr:SDR family NAD(P)-dependent oxidoreductase [Candidatus Neomarinimicrobiota bacterium]